MIHWKWQKMLDNQEKEMWTDEQLFEAMSAMVDFKYEERSHTDYFYVMRMGGLRFVIIKDLMRNIVQVYYPVTEGATLDRHKPFLEFTEEALEEMARE